MMGLKLVHRNEIFIRDPFTEPPAIKNVDGVCFSVSVLQLLFSCPSLMILFYTTNRCPSEVRQYLQTNPSNNYRKQIEYDYFVHEIMTIMSFRYSNIVNKKLSENQSILCEKEVKDDSKFEMSNLFLWHFYRLVTMGSNDWIARREESGHLDTIIVSPKKCRQIDEETQKNMVKNEQTGMWNKIKSIAYSTQTALYYEIFGFNKTMESFRMVHNLLQTFDSVFMFFLNFMFYGPTSHHDDGKTIVRSFHGKDLETELNSTIIFPSPMSLTGEFVRYYSKLNLLYLKLNAKREFNTLNQTNMYIPQQKHILNWEYVWNEHLFLDTNQFFPRRIRELIGNRLPPRTIIIDMEKRKEKNFNKPMALQVSEVTLDQLIHFVQLSFKELDGIKSFIPETSFIYPQFRTVQTLWPENFWLENEPSKMRWLIDSFSDGRRHIQYELSSIVLTETHSFYSIALEDIKNDHLTFNHPHYDLLYEKRTHDMSQRVYDHPIVQAIINKCDEDLARVIYVEIERLMGKIIFSETAYNLLQLSKFTKIDIDLPRIFLFPNNLIDHSVAVVRTYNLNWFYVTNDQQFKIHNLKEFFYLYHSKLRLIPEQTSWERSDNNIDGSRTYLRSVIKPITKSC
ncbi:hypothetical protein SNEBB_010768 [Seison nebaliae]|nr:hypothetical protein SNEBB_010768 [Seison nebaliae]